MSKGLEDRIGDVPSVDVFDSKLIFESNTFPCSLIKTVIDFDKDRKILKLKVTPEVMEHIYDGAIPIGLNRTSGELNFQEVSIYKVSCETQEAFSGSKTVLVLEMDR